MQYKATPSLIDDDMCGRNVSEVEIAFPFSIGLFFRLGVRKLIDLRTVLIPDADRALVADAVRPEAVDVESAAESMLVHTYTVRDTAPCEGQAR